MGTRLRALKIRAIATVDSGDNPHAKIVFYKRKDGTMADKTPTVEELQKQLKDATEKLATATAKQAELQTQLDGKKAPPPDPLAKADPVIKAEVEALRKRAEEAEKREKANADAIAKMQTDKRRAEFVAKAANFPSLGHADDAGQILAKIDGVLDEAERTSFFQKLQSMETLIKKSGLFGEMGRDTGEAATAEQKIDKAARVLIQKARENGTTLQYHDAYSQALKANPDLYTAYRAEQEGR